MGVKLLCQTSNQATKGRDICVSIKYYHELLKRFGMADSKSIDTLMPINGNLDRDEHGKDVDIKMYRGVIEYLLYLIASMPDIMFCV